MFPASAFYALTIGLSYLIGAIPFSYYLARAASGKDLTRVGTGNIGAMNVRRATGSWAWFAAAVVLDGVKGFLPVLAARTLALFTAADPGVAAGLGLVFSVLGHNYSVIAWSVTGSIASGRGLATGGGALLAYNWVYLAACLAYALPVIFLTGYLLVAQVTVPFFLLVVAYLTEPADIPYLAAVTGLILARHAPRLLDLVSGREPKWNIKDHQQVRSSTRGRPPRR